MSDSSSAGGWEIAGRSRGCRLKSRAFTLLELLLILGIVALMAGAVTLQFRQPYRRVRFEAVAETLVAIDRQVRSRARAANVAGLLQIDLEWHKLTPRFPAGVAATLPEYQLPSGFMLTRLRTSGGEDRGGRVGVVIRPSGVSITYALLLETDEQSRWIVFLGGTGQVVFVENVNEVQKLFKSLREEGVDFN